MQSFEFIFTVCFVLLGPIRLIPAFAKLTAGREPGFRSKSALWGTLLATLVCVFVLLMGDALVGKYRLSLPALQLSAGLVLLLSALRTIFPPVVTSDVAPAAAAVSPLKFAVSPLATPTIVPPAGIALLLIIVMVAPKYPGMLQALATSLGVIMALNFLVMFFNAPILRVPGLLPVLQLLGGVLIVIQVALGVDSMLSAFRGLGLVTGT